MLTSSAGSMRSVQVGPWNAFAPRPRTGCQPSEQTAGADWARRAGPAGPAGLVVPAEIYPPREQSHADIAHRRGDSWARRETSSLPLQWQPVLHSCDSCPRSAIITTRLSAMLW